MSHTWKWIIGIMVIVLVMGGWVAGGYNRLVASDQGVSGQWGQVEAAYQRRFDLIPNVVAAVKGSLKQEQAVFGAIAEARTQYGSAKSVDEKVAAANQVESALSRLLVIVENYPILKSSEVVQNLITELEGTENRISVERRRYNDVVGEYNIMVKRFPGNLLAGVFGFHEKPFFAAQVGAAEAPKVNLDVK